MNHLEKWMKPNVNAQNNYKSADDIRSDAYVYSSSSGTSPSIPPKPANIPLWKVSPAKNVSPLPKCTYNTKRFSQLSPPESQQESAQLK